MRKFLLILIILAATKVRTFSQCGSLVTPDASSAYPYALRSNRCEGFYEAEVGAPSIEVVGFYRGAFGFSHNADETITVIAQVNDFQSWHIQAVGIPLNFYYRMDAKFADDGQLNWPTKDVIHPKHVDSRAIGVYAWKEKEGRRYFSPVKIKTKHLQLAEDGKLHLMIRASSAISEVYWRFSTQSWHSVIKDFAAGEAIAIEFPLTGQSEFHVELKLKERSSGRYIPKKIYLSL